MPSPVQVLHKFLQVFADFNWDKECLSLQGPIALDELQDAAGVQPPWQLSCPRAWSSRQASASLPQADSRWSSGG